MHVLINSMKQSPSWESNRSSDKLVKNFPAFVNTERSLVFPQESAICPQLELDETHFYYRPLIYI